MARVTGKGFAVLIALGTILLAIISDATRAVSWPYFLFSLIAYAATPYIVPTPTPAISEGNDRVRAYPAIPLHNTI